MIEVAGKKQVERTRSNSSFKVFKASVNERDSKVSDRKTNSLNAGVRKLTKVIHLQIFCMAERLLKQVFYFLGRCGQLTSGVLGSFREISFFAHRNTNSQDNRQTM